MNLTDIQENRYFSRWVKNLGKIELDEFDFNQIKKNVKKLAECISTKIDNSEKNRILDYLTGYTLTLDSDYFLSQIRKFAEEDDEKDRRQKKANIENDFERNHPLKEIEHFIYKDQNAAKKSILAKLRTTDSYVSSETNVVKDSEVAAKSLNSKVSTMAAFFVALDIYSKLNKQSMEDNPEKTILSYLAKLLAQIEEDVAEKYEKRKISDEDISDNPSDDKFTADDVEQIKQYVLKEIADDHFVYDDLEKSTIKTIVNTLDRYIWERLYPTQTQDAKDDKRVENIYKNQDRFIKKLVVLTMFIYRCMRQLPEYKTDIDIDIYKNEIGKDLIRLLQTQTAYKTKRRQKIEGSHGTPEYDDDIDQWYYDVFFDNEFYNHYMSENESDRVYDSNLSDEDSEKIKREKSDKYASQSYTNYNNAFSLTVEKTADKKYHFLLLLGVPANSEEFFKMYVYVLRAYANRLFTIAFMPFDETLYHFVGSFQDITVSYDESNQQIQISGVTDLSNYSDQNEKYFLDSIADDMAMLQNQLKRASIIDQLRSSTTSNNKALSGYSHYSGRFSPYQGYIYKLYYQKVGEKEPTDNSEKAKNEQNAQPNQNQQQQNPQDSQDSQQQPAPEQSAPEQPAQVQSAPEQGQQPPTQKQPSNDTAHIPQGQDAFFNS